MTVGAEKFPNVDRGSAQRRTSTNKLVDGGRQMTWLSEGVRGVWGRPVSCNGRPAAEMMIMMMKYYLRS